MRRYVAIFLWVLANAIWAHGQLYNTDTGYEDDTPPPLFRTVKLFFFFSGARWLIRRKRGQG